MDSGPFRTPQPSERRVVSRPEPTTRPPEEPQPIKEEPKTVYRASTNHTTNDKSPKMVYFIIGAVIAVAVILAGVWFALSRNSSGSTDTGIDSAKYQAVFFTNGQVYFGKLQAFNDQYLKLTKIYYLQTTAQSTDSKNPQETSSDQASSVNLIKLGNEIHGPEDEMIISKDQVLFYENLKSDSKVAKLIDQQK